MGGIKDPAGPTTNNKMNTYRLNPIRQAYRALLPLAALAVVLIMHNAMPTSSGYRVKENSYFSILIYILMALLRLGLFLAFLSEKRGKNLSINYGFCSRSSF
jgi:predicted membrane channel-forming protein YqfA (hemolysin III family)